MKRYVKEIANEFLNIKFYPEEYKQKIKKVVNYAERGLITSLEAVQMIIQIDQELKEIHNNN